MRRMYRRRKWLYNTILIVILLIASSNKLSQSYLVVNAKQDIDNVISNVTNIFKNTNFDTKTVDKLVDLLANYETAMNYYYDNQDLLHDSSVPVDIRNKISDSQRKANSFAVKYNKIMKTFEDVIDTLDPEGALPRHLTLGT